MNKIILDKIVVKDSRVDYFFSTKGNMNKYFKKSSHMFLQYNFSLTNVPKSILAIPFVSNVTPLVWITNSVLKVEELDRTFYECLPNIRNAYHKMFPDAEFGGSLVVNEVIENSYIPEIEAASLFSGGLDAMTTFVRIKEKKPILITEYGWHGDEANNNEVWQADKKNALNFAKINGLNNILIQSNYGTFMNSRNIDHDYSKKLGDTWWHGLHHALAIISAAIPIAFKLKVKCIYIGSSNTSLNQVTCASDPSVDNEIKYGSGEVFHDGYELTRQDKVKVITDYFSGAGERVHLRVCFRNEENCCHCEKCLRTLLGIVAEGKNPQDYGFDVPHNLSQYVKAFLSQEIKFFTSDFIKMYWVPIQTRMNENRDKIIYQDLVDWFMDYDFETQRRRELLKYRVTHLFPILKRKISIRFQGLFTQNS